MDCIDEKAEKFVKTLLSDGELAACDDSCNSFNREKEELPQFYDEKLFKRGQRFYHENMYSVFGATFFGLIAVVSVPSILKVLLSTKESSTEFSAYKRYRATIIYFKMWHDTKFGPNSDLWKTLNAVRSLHNAASKSQIKKGQPRITQKDMALTQYGFMGIHIARPNFFALEYVSQETWRAYIHFWRVMGWILGIDDKFNICRESVEETEKICQKITDEFLTYYKRNDADFKQMAKNICDGLWHISVTLNYNVVMTMYPMILENDEKDKKNRASQLSIWEKLNALYKKLAVNSMKFPLMRKFWNMKQRIDIWLAENIPLWAILHYGYKNSFVNILGKLR